MRPLRAAIFSLALALCALPAARAAGEGAPDAATLEARRHEVLETERAFARTMARRDHAAFRGFLSPEAVFFDGPHATRGAEAVAAAWKPLFEGADAPFSWEPATVEVLDSGDLALSTGPVRNAQGKVVATFSSIWRRDAPGTWHIVFDKGCPACDCAAAR